MFLYGCSSMQSWWPMDQEFDEDPAVFLVNIVFGIDLLKITCRPIITFDYNTFIATRGYITW